MVDHLVDRVGHVLPLTVGELEPHEVLQWYAAQFVTGDNVARFFQKQGEDLERLFRQLHTQAMLAKLPSFWINFENPETKDLCRDSGRWHRVTARSGV